MTARRRDLLGTTERPLRRITAVGKSRPGHFFARLECGHRVDALKPFARLFFGGRRTMRCPTCQEVPK